jgi:hypothetical protein
MTAELDEADGQGFDNEGDIARLSLRHGANDQECEGHVPDPD